MAKTGEILAIVGESGSGKTSLISHLSHRYPKNFNFIFSDESKTSINGTPYD
jgi:ABC-type glutathione transport system ATPase component